jgi:DNA excision repair protein ERCC-2
MESQSINNNPRDRSKLKTVIDESIISKLESKLQVFDQSVKSIDSDPSDDQSKNQSIDDRSIDQPIDQAIEKIKVDLKNQKVFPYDNPSQIQTQIMKFISKVPSGKIIIEAPTGSGKSIASLSALISKKKENEKVIVFVRTIAQMEPILREFQSISKRLLELRTIDESNLTILPVLGKNRLCDARKIIGLTDQKIDRSHSIDLCKGLPCPLAIDRSNRKMLYPAYRGKELLIELKNLLIEHDEKLSPGTSSIPIATFSNFLHKKENCGYYSSRSMIPESDIIIAPYAYLQRDRLGMLLKNIGMSIDQTLILIDEAHNLIRSEVLIYRKVDHERLVDYFGETRLLEEITRLFSAPGSIERLQRGVNIDRSIPRSIREKGIKQIEMLIDRYEVVYGQLEDHEIKQSVDILKSIVFAKPENVIIASNRSITLLDCLPSLTIRNIRDAKLTVFQSATISPIEEFAKIFGIYSLKDRAFLLNTSIDRSKNQFNCYIRTSKMMTSKVDKRIAATFENMSEIIQAAFDRSPRHCLVLCPSYEFKDQLIQKLQIDRNLVLEEKPTSTTEEINEIPLRSIDKLLMIGVAGGKMSEGNEIVYNKKSLISTVIIAGLPYPVPSEADQTIKNLRGRLIGKDTAEKFTVDIPLLQTIRQSQGRAIRRETDRGALIILDTRIGRSVKILESIAPRRVTSIASLKEGMDRFFEGYETINSIFRSNDN